MRLLITGGAGFIGSELVRHILASTDHHVLNVDALTYAGRLASLVDIQGHDRHLFLHAGIGDAIRMRKAILAFEPNAIINLAAQTHVDRSIDNSTPCTDTSIVSTYRFLEVSRNYWKQLSTERRNAFRFIHVSTDEVYVDIGSEHAPATDDTAYHPSSPYAASATCDRHDGQ